MDCVIQAFPDEYHLQTLEPLLETTTNLNPQVDIKNIFIHLMDKLSKYAASTDSDIIGINKDLDIFKLFKKYTDKIIETQGKTREVSGLLELEVAFLNFAINTYPKNLDYVNQILESCCQILKATPINNQDQAAMKLLVRLLSIPLDSLSIAVLNMNNYLTLMQYMKFSQRRVVALRIVKAVIKDNKKLDREKIVEQLIDFVMPLLVDDKDSEPVEPYEFEESQESVAKLVHLVNHRTNNDLYFEILMKFKRVFVKGGHSRMKYTVPPLVFAFFRLSREIVQRSEHPPQPAEEEEKAEGAEEKKSDEEEARPLSKVDQMKIFKTVNELILLVQAQFPDMALRLYLQATEAINQVPNNEPLEELAYEFCS